MDFEEHPAFFEQGPTLQEVLAAVRKSGDDALVQDVQNRLKSLVQNRLKTLDPRPLDP